MKRDHLFYGQRDAYSRSSGTGDLHHLIVLPKPIAIPAGKTIYAKASIANMNRRKALFDVLITLYYE